MEWVLEVYTVHNFGKDTHTLHHTHSERSSSICCFAHTEKEKFELLL